MREQFQSIRAWHHESLGGSSHSLPCVARSHQISPLEWENVTGMSPASTISMNQKTVRPRRSDSFSEYRGKRAKVEQKILKSALILQWPSGAHAVAVAFTDWYRICCVICVYLRRPDMEPEIEWSTITTHLCTITVREVFIRTNALCVCRSLKADLEYEQWLYHASEVLASTNTLLIPFVKR